ncbi:MAG TPA: ABC transporter permease [Anaerolineales bacterium]|nr:ABC transporter permease [Anaerolineales bacterium]
MDSSPASSVYDTDLLKPNFLREIGEAYRYRYLIWQLISRNIKIRYKRSFLGIAWSMLNPLGTMIVMVIVFSTLFGRGVNYPVYLLTGLLAWSFFSEASTMIINSMIWGSSLLQRIYLPRTAFALSAVGTGLVNLLLAIIPLLIIMLFTGAPIRPAVLFTLIPMLLLLMFTLGVGLALSIGAMYFADISEMFKVVLRAWMYLTPIIYPESLLASNGYGWVLRFNPMYYLIRVFREPFETGTLPSWDVFLPALLIAVFTLVLGWLVFTWYSDEFTHLV